MFFWTACGGHYNTFPRQRPSDLNEPAALKALTDAGQTVNDGDFRIVDVRPEFIVCLGFPGFSACKLTSMGESNEGTHEAWLVRMLHMAWALPLGCSAYLC